MALDRLTQITASGISSTSPLLGVNITGVVTATSLTATTGTFSGNVSVAGTITYEDTTNVDSIGIVTARSGLNVGVGGTVITATVGGSVGIGTTNPQPSPAGGFPQKGSILQVNSTIRLDGTSNPYFQISDNSNNIGYFQIASGLLDLNHNGSISFSPGGSERVRITGTGSVGIGLTNPSSRLTIKSPGASTTFLNALNSGNTSIFRITQTTGGSGYLELGDSTANTFMVADAASGFIGIGTTNPSTTLEVNGTSNPALFKHTGGDGLQVSRQSKTLGFNANYSNLNTHALITASSGMDLAFATNGDIEKVRIKGSDCFVGIGSANPDSILYVGSGPDAIINGNATSRIVVNDSGNRQADFFARNHVDDVMCRMTAYSGGVVFGSITNHQIEFWINNVGALAIDTSGNFIPFSNNTNNLGSPNSRWANIYSADLQLSNEGSQNDIDGTWGNYTIQEGENDLFLINRRTGRKYKFLLEEVK